MRLLLLTFFLFALPVSNAYAVSSNQIIISGKVVDKDGNPVSKCDVFFNKQAWITDDSPHVTCDAEGNYKATIDPGLYNSFYVCDEEKYAKTALEFWGWNLHLTQSQTIDVAFDTLEVYSLSTWASNGGSNSIFASFRPMSLKKPHFYNKIVDGKTIAILDVAPAINASSIEGSIDGAALELLNYNWTYEKINSCGSFPKEIDTSNGCYMPMIITQLKKPKLKAGLHTLKIRLTDFEDHHIGEGITHFTSNKKALGF